jgi:hypothetical protein
VPPSSIAAGQRRGGFRSSGYGCLSSASTSVAVPRTPRKSRGASQQGGLAGYLAIHPHQPRWRDFAALVSDGVARVRGRPSTRSSSNQALVTFLGDPEDNRKTSSKERERASSKDKSSKFSRKNSSKSKKSEKSGQDEVKVSSSSGRAGVSTTPAPAPAVPQGTVAGGGGRWVHIPN